ncbi:Ndd-like nucleoid disruption protein [Acinetobacter phage Acj9]|uniref:Nucleoid disruption protein n=1 Tax=Acinetobacter phage Acj9 TaxID=760939 RepID=E5EQ35_9CAUD|nr:Ndd-like nucleoid disruption protein [Acinetobacter phage Acj9]ADG60151.1 Ndd nucleoid disruption protein [Acinetobacter phage Acj9]
MKPTRSIMTRKDLKLAKAQHIATTTRVTMVLSEPKIDEPPVSDLTKPGFYFFVHPVTQVVVSRFYVGQQRTKAGLRAIVSHLRTTRSTPGKIMKALSTPFDVYFIPVDKMKVLTNGFGKGKWALKFVRQHSGDFQNLEEMNRMLNDNFKFYAQSY